MSIGLFKRLPHHAEENPCVHWADLILIVDAVDVLVTLFASSGWTTPLRQCRRDFDADSRRLGDLYLMIRVKLLESNAFHYDLSRHRISKSPSCRTNFNNAVLQKWFTHWANYHVAEYGQQSARPNRG